MSSHARLDPRPITPELLDEFECWTHTALMFISSPEGDAFGKEMRGVITLARKALETEKAAT